MVTLTFWNAVRNDNCRYCNGNCDKKDIYRGETATNAYTRGDEHMRNLNRHDERNSPLWRHCLEVHNGEMQEFTMKVTGTYRKDAMLRQISEAVKIENTDADRLMNTRSEWNMTRVPRATVTYE